MAAAIKMDELLTNWLGSDEVYENVLNLIEKYREHRQQQSLSPPSSPTPNSNANANANANAISLEDPAHSPRGVVIPPFYPLQTPTGTKLPRRRQLPRQAETWDRLPDTLTPPPNETLATAAASAAAGVSAKLASKPTPSNKTNAGHEEQLPEDEQQEDTQTTTPSALCVRDQVQNILPELSISKTQKGEVIFSLESFIRITKEICNFPSFFNGPLYQRIIDLWNVAKNQTVKAVTLQMLEWFWKTEMEPYDPPERFFRLIKQPQNDCILRDDFLPCIKALLNDHPVSYRQYLSFTVSI